MGYSIQSRAGLTIQVPIPSLAELTQLAELLGVARHWLARLALSAGLPFTIEQIRAKHAAVAAQQPPATPSPKGEWIWPAMIARTLGNG